MKVSIKYVPIGQEFLDCKGICTFVRAKAPVDLILISLPNMSIAIPEHLLRNLMLNTLNNTMEKDLESHPNPEDGWLYMTKENS